MKRRLKDYVVCSGHTAYALGEKVLEHSRLGYDLEGGVFMGEVYHEKYGCTMLYLQAMALYKGADAS